MKALVAMYCADLRLVGVLPGTLERKTDSSVSINAYLRELRRVCSDLEHLEL
jgi:hypothetical protein